MDDNSGHHKPQKWHCVPPFVLGLLLLSWGINYVDVAPERKHVEEYSRTLRVIRVPKIDVVPRIFSFGIVEPANIWRAEAEVKGKVISVHPEFKIGAFVKKDAEILKIDSTEYDHSVALLESEIEQIKVEMAKLEVEESNLLAELELEEAVAIEKSSSRSV